MFGNSSNLSELIFDIEDGTSVPPTTQDHSSYYWFWHICDFLVKGEYHKSLSLLLSFLPLCDDSVDNRLDCLWIHFQLSCLIEDQALQKSLSKKIILLSSFNDWRRLHTLCYISRSRDLIVYSLDICREFERLTTSIPPHLEVEYIYYLLFCNKSNQAISRFSRFRYLYSCEYLLLDAKIKLDESNHSAAQVCLVSGLKQFANRFDYAYEIVELLFDQQCEELCLPVLKYLLPYHQTGYSASRLRERYAQAMLLQHKFAPALRTKLLERLPIVSGNVVTSISTLINAYCFLGRSNWFEYLPDHYLKNPSLHPELFENLLMYSSSRASDQYPQLALTYRFFLEKMVRKYVPPFKAISRGKSPYKDSKKLRIGWVCGDITQHPVARFLYSWLSSLTAGHVQHQHFVISTYKSNPEYSDLFTHLEFVQYHDISHCSDIPQHVQELRALELDIALDLNGWTGNNVMSAFIARIAPIQINYLAYHASSGIAQMDYWLVDNELIPSNTSQSSTPEWHTETLLRLDRPFLAWQPPYALPEGKAKVTEFSGQHDSFIHYGCFNNSRKISLETLHTWSLILRHESGSRLVLKAFESDDPATSILLRRRLVDSGISLDQVIFLPYSPTPFEHLLQYSRIDVALDCHPNSGCTTTCEALWMGVPVLTLTGNHYVSRMSHSVLSGIGLSDWIAYSRSEYIKKAIDLADFKQLTWLRQNRSYWRNKIQNSNFGDASDLMHHLISKFQQLYSKFVRDFESNVLVD